MIRVSEDLWRNAGSTCTVRAEVRSRDFSHWMQVRSNSGISCPDMTTVR